LKQNKILLALLAILVFFSSFALFIQPVHAGSYTIDLQPKYVTIGCGTCNANHKVTYEEYVLSYYNFMSDLSKVKIDCQLCGQTHCRVAIEESGMKNLAYKVAVGANSDFATYKSILNSEE
jgi:hypothetical protein